MIHFLPFAFSILFFVRLTSPLFKSPHHKSHKSSILGLWYSHCFFTDPIQLIFITFWRVMLKLDTMPHSKPGFSSYLLPVCYGWYFYFCACLFAIVWQLLSHIHCGPCSLSCFPADITPSASITLALCRCFRPESCTVSTELSLTL